MMYAKQVAKPKTSEKLTRAFVLLYYGGFRISELLQITRANIHSILGVETEKGTEKSGAFSLTNATKTKTARLVLFSKNGVAAIKEIFEMDWDPEIDDMNRLVFEPRNKNSKALGKHGFLKLINFHIQEALGPTFSSHSFRKGIISDMLNKRIPLKTVSQFIGHSDIKTTILYHSISEEDMKEAAELAR